MPRELGDVQPVRSRKRGVETVQSLLAVGCWGKAQGGPQAKRCGAAGCCAAMAHEKQSRDGVRGTGCGGAVSALWPSGLGAL